MFFLNENSQLDRSHHHSGAISNHVKIAQHVFSEKMTPHDLSTATSPVMDPEEIRMRKMNRRSKVIQELVQTEKDYLTDLELCVREVVQPLRNLQVKRRSG